MRMQGEQWGARAALMVVGIVVALILLVERSKADPPVATLTSNSVTCGPPNLALANVDCGDGYRAVRVESESATAIYLGGAGMTGVNRTTFGLKRCTTCNSGPAFSADVNMRQLKCVADGSTDAGVVVAVLCGK